MSNEIAEQWFADAAYSAGQKDLESHMGMISKQVSLQGVPGFDNIDYVRWYAQFKHGCENGLIKSIDYSGLRLIAATDSHIMLKTLETVVGADGTVNRQGVEMLLEMEDDGVRRLVQERVLSEGEAIHDNLLP